MIYEGLKSNKEAIAKKFMIVWKAMNLSRYIFTYVVLLTLINYPALQIMSLLLVSVVQ